MTPAKAIFARKCKLIQRALLYKLEGMAIYPLLYMAGHELNRKVDPMVDTKIKQILQEFRGAISKTDSDGIASALGKLDRITREQQREIDPRLLHFLRQRSYEKAFDYLGGESGMPPGNCGGRS